MCVFIFVCVYVSVYKNIDLLANHLISCHWKLHKTPKKTGFVWLV